MSYGKHLTLLIENIENIDNLNEEKKIKELLTDLTHRIKMRVLVPAVAGFEDGDVFNVGYSGVIILCESHIAIHTYSGIKKAFIDVFSCKDYEEKDIIDFLHERVGNFEIKEKNIKDRGRHWQADIEKEFNQWEGKR